jgi:hypothetical protein
MSKTKSNSKRKVIDKILSLFGVVATLVLLAVGGLAWWAYSFATNTVHDQLAAQNIYFPPKGSPAITALPAADQVEMNKYAGQQLVNGAQAKVYADNFIAYHLTKVANGKTYSQVSSAALADPTNTKLKAEEQTLFQGETLRGLLLGDGYAYGTIGHIAEIAAIVCFAAAGLMAILTVLGFWHMSTL